MHGPDCAWALLIALMLGGLALALAGLLFLLWRVWRRTAAWWRWPALAGIALLLLGGGIALGQALGELL